MRKVDWKPGGSHIVKSITDLKNDQTTAHLTDSSCYKWKVSDGDRTYFWEDNWQEEGPLCNQLPRLYKISKLKYSTIKNCWTLGIQDVRKPCLWTRALLERDDTQLNKLAVLTKKVKLVRGKDTLLWLPGKGKFSTKAFTDLYSSPSLRHDNGWNHIWAVKLTPKLMIFLWKLHWKILPTKKFLSARINYIGLECAWCNREEETIEHLFWTCEIAQWAWGFIADWWSCIKQFRSIGAFSVIKLLSCFNGNKVKKVWGLVITVTLWSIWLARNEALFSKRRVSKSDFEFIILTRTEQWGKATNILNFGSDPLWKVNPHGALSLYFSHVARNFWRYKAENQDILCAVDGAWGVSIDGNLRGGIGGCFKTTKGALLHVFSGPVAVEGPLEAELEALLHAINMALSNKLLNQRVAICSDSIIAVEQIRKGLKWYIPLSGTPFKIDKLLGSKTSLHHVPRELNEEADKLAREGLNRKVLTSYWASSP